MPVSVLDKAANCPISAQSQKLSSDLSEAADGIIATYGVAYE